MLAIIYTITHRGTSYSKSFVHTIVFVSITINLIMLIIGSNIARAFALVGAMSIVRFRNPIKDSRDLIFIFMSMAIGMATGTQFYIFSIIFSLFAGMLLLAFHYFDFGESANKMMVLRINMPEAAKDDVEKICASHCKSTSIIAIDKSAEGAAAMELILEVELLKGGSYNKLLDSLLTASEDMTVNLLVGESSISA